MKKTALVLLFLPFFIHAQKPMTQVEMESKLDEILIESNLLYEYEKSAITTINFVESNRKMRKSFSEVFTYKESDTVKTIILNSDRKMSLSEFSFYSDFNIPKSQNLNVRNLSEKELRLLTTRQMIYNDINKKGFEIKGLEGYDIHSILIPSDNGFKLYVITAAKTNNDIPFSNDYLFISDKNGTITSHEKFHSRLIPTPTKFNGNKVVSSFHTHLETTPFITATVICTFRIYGKLYDMKDFKVLSTALDKIFKYDLVKNEIEISDAPK